MNYDVSWLPAAEKELASIWLDSSVRQSVTEAAKRIDELLARSPSEQGESRYGDIRILFVRPLGTLFRVDPSTRRVEVVAVWKVRAR